MEIGKDVLWFYPGLTSDSGDSTTYPGYDDGDPPDTSKNYTEPNFWLEIYTDKNIGSQGFTFSVSASDGKSIYCTAVFTHDLSFKDCLKWIINNHLHFHDL